jgi:hypothetical protein
VGEGCVLVQYTGQRESVKESNKRDNRVMMFIIDHDRGINTINYEQRNIMNIIIKMKGRKGGKPRNYEGRS